ncbi:sensor histidine kinase, partial [Candidatus Altiarchaeota archaeon]
DGEVKVGASIQGGYVISSVADTGIGLSAADVKNIFDRFFQVDSGITRQRAGSGLGLSIVKSILERHGSRIWVDSKEGEGTTFFFSFNRMKGMENE